MTSASKLFHNRRIQFGRSSNTADDKDSDSSPADGNSYRRTTTNRRHHRQDLGGCNPPTRRNHRNRLSEHEVVQLESPSGSIINSDDFRSIRRWGSTVNDRLPGVVLLARERLVERLRGVHISENSRSSSSNIQQDESRFNETNNNNLVEVMAPPGLDENAINGLSITVFKNVEEKEERSRERECSICLEGFEEGDQLINLACMHSFHSCCLFPWIEVCGACPNCRKTLLVTNKPLSSSFWGSL